MEDNNNNKNNGSRYKEMYDKPRPKKNPGLEVPGLFSLFNLFEAFEILETSTNKANRRRAKRIIWTYVITILIAVGAIILIMTLMK